MSENGIATSVWATVLTAIIAAGNLAFTTYVNGTVEHTKSDLQLAVQRSELSNAQVKAVTGIENDAYLNCIPKLQTAIENSLEFAESVTEGTVPEQIRDQTAERHRLKVRLLTAACQPRPNDAKLIAAANLLNKNVDLLRQSIIENKISEDYGTRMSNLIDALKTFQAEVYRVAEAGYGAADVSSQPQRSSSASSRGR